MKKLFTFFVLVLFAFIFTGCSTTPVINVNTADQQLKVGDNFTINAKVTEGFKLVYSAEDPEVLKVTDNVVVALKEGITTVTVKVDGKDISKKIKFTVTKAEVQVEGITISGATTGVEGDEITLTATVNPNNATDRTVTWTTSDATLATVVNGVVTLLKAGTVTITAKAGAKEATHTIVISAKVIEVETVEISGATAGIVGGEITLTATVNPNNATDKTITWTTSDATLATVVNGKVTLLKEGTVTITAKAGEKEATHTIIISVKVIEVETVEISGATAGVEGDEITLTATVNPNNATDKTVTWKTSDSELATVVNGKVILLKAGTVTITAKAGEKEATHVITILPVVDDIEVTLERSVIYIGETIYIYVEVIHQEDDDVEYFISSNSNHIHIDSEKELITAVSVGVAIITVVAGNKSVQVEIEVKELSISKETLSNVLQLLMKQYREALTGEIKLSINQGGTSLVTEFAYQYTETGIKELKYSQTSSATNHIYVKDGYVYMLRNGQKGKLLLSETEAEALKNQYGFDAITKTATAFYGEYAFFEHITLIEEKDGLYTFELDLVNYNGSSFRTAGKNSIKLVVAADGVEVSKVEVLIEDADGTLNQVAIEFLGTGIPKIKFPTDLSKYPDLDE